MICLTLGCSALSNFIIARQRVYGKLEKQSLWPFWDRPGKLLVRHAASKSEMSGPFCHVIVVYVEHHMLQSSRHGDFHRRKRSRYECAKTVAKFLETVGCDDFSGFLQQCGGTNQLQSYRFGH